VKLVSACHRRAQIKRIEMTVHLEFVSSTFNTHCYVGNDKNGTIIKMWIPHNRKIKAKKEIVIEIDYDEKEAK
jgi:hypothetical protein